MPADINITLPDGRQLTSREFGDPHGKPAFYFHGLPGSRLDLMMLEPELLAGLHIVAVDRPGIGASTYLPGRTFTDWPADVAALADHLGWDRFRVLSVSGGSPYALVCAARLSQRVDCALLISPVAPLNAPGVTKGMGPGKLFFQLSRWAPFVANFQLEMMRSGAMKNPQGFLNQVSGTMPKPDQDALNREPAASGFMASMQAALLAGVQGTRYDASLYARPWPFKLEEVQSPVYLWHGEADRNAPVAMARYLAEQIPQCTVRIYPDEGHLSVFTNHAEEILSVLKR